MDAPPLCLSADIADRNDKSEPIPHLEDSVRIIMDWCACPLSNPPLVGVMVLFLANIARFICEVENDIQFYNEVHPHQTLQYKKSQT